MMKKVNLGGASTAGLRLLNYVYPYCRLHPGSPFHGGEGITGKEGRWTSSGGTPVLYSLDHCGIHVSAQICFYLSGALRKL